jgi:hypothetical protein
VSLLVKMSIVAILVQQRKREKEQLMKYSQNVLPFSMLYQ